MRDHPRILIASDLTARSDRAFDRAVALAEERQGSVLLLHVVEDGGQGAPLPPVEEVRARMAAQLPPTKAPIEPVVLAGSAPTRIAEAAAELDADLVVVGAARFNEVRDHFLGTAVDFLVRRAPVPVLVVKKRPLGRYGHVLAATDFSDCSAHAARVAAELLPQGRLALVHAFTTPFPSRLDQGEMRPLAEKMAQEEMEAFLARDAIAPIRARIDPRIEEGNVVAVVGRLVRDASIDLVVLGTHGRGGFLHALIGSHASDLVARVPCDVLMVREVAETEAG